MSRTKKYPDRLYGCWGGDKKDVLVFFKKEVADALMLTGTNIEIYDHREAPTSGEIIDSYHKPEAYEVARKQAVTPKEQDKPPQTQPEALPNATGEAGETTVAHLSAEDKQDLADAEKSLAESGSVPLDELKKKRHRRTKAEIGADKRAATAEKILLQEISRKAEIAEVERQMTKESAELEGKPKWKCRHCDWAGDAPHKIIRGPNKGNLVCPKCKIYEVVKNE